MEHSESRRTLALCILGTSTVPSSSYVALKSGAERWCAVLHMTIGDIFYRTNAVLASTFNATLHVRAGCSPTLGWTDGVWSLSLRCVVKTVLWHVRARCGRAGAGTVTLTL